jgi:hypothetical protein
MVDMDNNQHMEASMTLALAAQKEDMKLLHGTSPFANPGLYSFALGVILMLSHYLAGKHFLLHSSLYIFQIAVRK